MVTLWKEPEATTRELREATGDAAAAGGQAEMSRLSRYVRLCLAQFPQFPREGGVKKRG
jgi:hypothetical protein